MARKEEDQSMYRLITFQRIARRLGKLINRPQLQRGLSLSFLCPSDLQPKSNDPMKTPVQFITAVTQPATASLRARRIMLLLLSFSAGLASMQPCAATPMQWEYTGSLKTARFRHTATLLPD